MEFKNIKGSIVALITPFKEDGSVHFDALEKLVERRSKAALPRSCPWEPPASIRPCLTKRTTRS